VRSFTEPDLFDNSVPFDNTTPICLINLLWKLVLGLGLDLELHYFSIFFTENNENKHPSLPRISHKVTPCYKNAPERWTTKSNCIF